MLAVRERGRSLDKTHRSRKDERGTPIPGAWYCGASGGKGKHKERDPMSVTDVKEEERKRKLPSRVAP